MLKVCALTDKTYPYVTPSDLVTKVRSLMREHNLRMVPVVEALKLLGVVRRVDVIALTPTKANATVLEITRPPEVVLEVNDNVLDATLRMLEHDVWVAPVVESLMSSRYMGVYGIEGLIAEFINALPDLPVNEVMSPNVVTCHPNDSLSSVWHKMMKYGFSGIPVVNGDNKVVGMITQYDLLKRGDIRARLSRGEGTVMDVMTQAPIMLLNGEPIRRAAEIIVKSRVGRVVVVDEHRRVLGIVDREDLAKVITTCLKEGRW